MSFDNLINLCNEINKNHHFVYNTLKLDLMNAFFKAQHKMLVTAKLHIFLKLGLFVLLFIRNHRQLC